MINFSNPWLVVPHPNPQASCRLFCFPFAGGGATLFRSWSPAVPATLELCAVQLPGREERLHQPPLSTWPDLLAELTLALAPWLDKPFALFGHSLGARVALALAQHWHSQYAPRHLILSACPAPGISHLPPLHSLPDSDLIAAVDARYGNIPQALLAQPELLALFLPSLRADFMLYETYADHAATGPAGPLSCPLAVLGGLQDPLVSRQDLLAWRAQTTGRFTIRMFPGNHFFLKNAQSPLLQMIGQLIEER